MKVTLQLPNAQDVLYLIRAEFFFRIVDAWDLAQRNSETIEDAYHENWFSPDDNGAVAFNAPEFYLKRGIASFINGRHRSLLLRRHLEDFPMALTNMDGYPLYSSQPTPESEQTLGEIAARKLSVKEVFDFPDLPIKDLGYDHNIGK